MTLGAPARPDRDAIAGALERVRGAITAACAGAGRDARAVTLIAVSKTVGPAALEAALDAGHRTFGENRIQEAKAKWPALRARYPDIELHLIGPLQSNKVKEAVGLFDVIHTVDRPRLSTALATEMARQGRHPGLLIEVNTGAEPQKAGVLPQAADAFIAACRERDRLEPQGLMCIPPFDEPPGPHFALLAQVAARNRLAWLSMGMSADFEIAVAFGATHVRVGTAIFGQRPAAPIRS
jgi:pyridoxal phosphate enzyme (YggS family)